MDLGVYEAAELLKVSEKTIRRWLREGKLPAYREDEQYRFKQSELLEWAAAEKLPVSPAVLAGPIEPESILPTLEEALRSGGIFYRVAGNSVDSVLHSAVELMPLPEAVDRDFLEKCLLARESLSSTGLGGGIAIPHVRNPVVPGISRATVTVCFLQEPVDFRAIDGKPVHTLFLLVSPTIRAHLHLLSLMAFALRDPEFQRVVTSAPSPEELLAAARRCDESSCPPTAGK